MKLILITGLDGSGKSTLLNRLEEIAGDKPVAFLRVPKIETQLLKKNKPLEKAACFVNQMHVSADHLKTPQLKVIGLFSSMLLFKELLNELGSDSIKIIFCERHPLIDTGVYAKFYASKMNPENLPSHILRDIEIRYPDEISYLLHLAGVVSYPKGKAYGLLAHIHDWFYVKKKDTLPELKQLFGIGMPDKIVYLSASPEILMQRLASRKVLEAHESKEVLEKLIPVYEKIIVNSLVDTMYVQADHTAHLDKAYEELKKLF